MKKLPSIIRSSTSYKKKFQDFLLPLQITASNWAVLLSGQYMFGKLSTERKKIASLTKIMTAFTVIKYASQKSIDLAKELVAVTKNAASLGGTTAGLQNEDILTAWDLLHGMMLPSGNDAAFALAEHFGFLLYSDRFGSKRRYPFSPERFFISEMNKNAHLIHMFSTFYTNPHGLDHDHHKSCAYDISLLAHKAMKEPLFHKIVSCKAYEAEILDGDKNLRHVVWENTNVLLDKKGYNGIKTGITPDAGPCLCISYHVRKIDLIVVLLNSETTETRWAEAKSIVKYMVQLLTDGIIKRKHPMLTW